MTASLTARIDALDDYTRKSLLKYLAGYAPAAVRAGLDEMDRQAAEALEGESSE